MPTKKRPLKVFLCHTSADKPTVRELYQRLLTEGWINAWLDEEKLLPGQDWSVEIEKAVESTDTVIVCLSKSSLTREGYVQRELRLVLDIALTKPEETIYVIPLRLDKCEVPRRLRGSEYADYFPDDNRDLAYVRLRTSLEVRAQELGIRSKIQKPQPEHSSRRSNPKIKSVGSSSAVKRQNLKQYPNIDTLKNNVKKDYSYTTWSNIEFSHVPAGRFLMGSKKANSLATKDEIPQHSVEMFYDYWIARFPVTNEQYSLFVNATGKDHPVGGWKKRPNHPVVYISRSEAMAYCQWLHESVHDGLPNGLVLRLPTEAEWEKAARGEDGSEWPWGNKFDAGKCNTSEGRNNRTTQVGAYSPIGDSPYGCADMVGNVWEWTHTLFKSYPYSPSDGRECSKEPTNRYVVRGGSFDDVVDYARCAVRVPGSRLYGSGYALGFRLVISIPPINTSQTESR